MMLLEIILSAVNPLFFRTVVRKSAIRAFVYYLVFTAVYSLAISGLGLWWASRHWTPTLAVVENSLPPFEFGVNQGRLSTTLPEPVAYSDAGFALIVDTSGKELDASDYESAILIGQTKGIFKKNRFETREYSWSEIPDFQVTTTDVIRWLAGNKAMILWTVFSLLGFLVLPMAWLFLIPVLLFLAFLLLIVAKVLRSPLQYGQTLSIAFYAVTLPTLVQTVLLTQGVAGSRIFWLVYLAWAVIGVVVARGIQPPPNEIAAPPPPPAFPPPPQRS